jgi:putative ABC transport system permease protein
VGGSYLFSTFSEDMRTVVSVSSIFLAFGSAAAVGAFFGFYPANQAAKLDPIEALRYEEIACWSSSPERSVAQ